MTQSPSGPLLHGGREGIRLAQKTSGDPHGRRTTQVESAMAPVPNGTYTITRPPEQLLTLLDGASEPKTPVVLLPPTGNPGEQEWQLERLDNGNYTIRNLRSETHVSYDGDPEMNKPVVGYPEPREWALYQSAQPHAFHVVVPGGPVDGEEWAMDLSLLRIFPPRIALRPLDVANQDQAWTFQFME